MTGFNRFLEILETQPEITDKEDAIELTDVEGEIKFNNVSFSYDDNTVVLRNINLTIHKGQSCAGPSGGGKTTFVILSTFYEVDEGAITIDGKDIRM